MGVSRCGLGISQVQHGWIWDRVEAMFGVIKCNKRRWWEVLGGCSPCLDRVDSKGKGKEGMVHGGEDTGWE
ncbi:hypothetical protein PIB30_097338, partial [Stylosanthes scabra]|nr:hypothetical protein [Stylosanthes scabra]